MFERRTDVAPILAPPPLLFLLCLGIGLLGERYVFPSPFSCPTRLRFVVGGAILALASLLIGSAIVVMRRHATPVEPWEPTERIVVRGPFRLSRNPIYAGLVASMVGLGFLTGFAWLFVMTPVLFVLLERGVVLPEERYLSARFGEEYLAYLRSVPRWFGVRAPRSKGSSVGTEPPAGSNGQAAAG